MNIRETGSVRGILVFVMVFYIAVALLAIGILSERNSIFSMRNFLPFLTTSSDDNTRTELKESRVTGNVNKPEPEVVEPVEPTTEEAQTMVMDDSEGNITVQPGVLETPEEPAGEPEETRHYYSFTAINSTTILHMREEPDINSRSIYQVKPGTTGYVLELGDDWSQVTAEGHVGYCSNEYLNMQEIPEEEYPEELR